MPGPVTALHRGGPRAVAKVVAPPAPETPPATIVAPEAGMPDREELLNRQARLHRQRGRAVIDGQPFDHGELAAVERALEALDDGDAEISRRARDAAAHAATERRDRLASELAALSDARMAALGEAQQAASLMVEKLALVRHLSAQTIAAARAAGLPAPASLVWPELAKRLGYMVAAALRPIASHPGALGHLNWHISAQPFDDWTAAERRATAGDVQLHNGRH
jgi:alpha-D-ribose 1-methylphosphonate 5-triphosphate synthase subunit PhnG